MTGAKPALVTAEALQAFTTRLVEHFAPNKVILFGSLARGEGRWDSDADLMVLMSFEGSHLHKIREIRKTCQAKFPLDLLLWRPEEAAARYQQGDPFLREALDHGKVLHG
jgi:predicted nucleotidyltransferase